MFTRATYVLIGALINTALSWPLQNNVGYGSNNMNGKPPMLPGQVFLSKLYPLLNGNFEIKADILHIDAIPVTKSFVKPPFNYWFGKPGFAQNLYKFHYMNANPIKTVGLPFPIKSGQNIIATLPIINIKPVEPPLQRPKPGNQPIVSPWQRPVTGQGSILSPIERPNYGYQPIVPMLQRPVSGHGYLMSNYPKNEIESSLSGNKQMYPFGNQSYNLRPYNDQERHPNGVYGPGNSPKTEWTTETDKNQVTLNALLNQYHKLEQQMFTGQNAENSKNKITFNALLNQYNALKQQETSKDKNSDFGLYSYGQEKTENTVTLEQLYKDYNKINEQMEKPNGYVSTEHLNYNQEGKDYSNGVSYPTTTLLPPMTTSPIYMDKKTPHHETTPHPVTTPYTETKPYHPVTTQFPVTPQPKTNLYSETTPSHHKTTPYYVANSYKNTNGIPMKEDNTGKTTPSNMISILSNNIPTLDQRPFELLPSYNTTNEEKSASALPFVNPYENQISNENTYGSYAFPFETEYNSQYKNLMLPGESTYSEKPVLPFVGSQEYKPFSQVEKLNAKTESKSIPFEKPSGFRLFETTIIPFPKTSTPGPLNKEAIYTEK